MNKCSSRGSAVTRHAIDSNTGIVSLALGLNQQHLVMVRQLHRHELIMPRLNLKLYNTTVQLPQEQLNLIKVVCRLTCKNDPSTFKLNLQNKLLLPTPGRKRLRMFSKNTNLVIFQKKRTISKEELKEISKMMIINLKGNYKLKLTLDPETGKTIKLIVKILVMVL